MGARWASVGEDIVCAKESEMNTALVIVDMLGDFVDGRLANPAATPTIERIDALAEAARRRKDWIVVYGNDAHHPGDLELRVFGEHAMVGTPGAQVIDELAPAGGDIVVPKRYYSAFTQTDLAATCQVHGVGRVVIVGQHTDCCVRHTSYDAFLRGFEVVVPADATAVFQPLSEEPVAARQERALDYLRTFYGVRVVGTADLLGETGDSPAQSGQTAATPERS
jgi:nicotinamidase-related amidase